MTASRFCPDSQQVSHLLSYPVAFPASGNHDSGPPASPAARYVPGVSDGTEGSDAADSSHDRRSHARRAEPMRIALVTNHPPPFRTPIYERIATMPDVELHAVFCSRREPNRKWEVPPMSFHHRFLKERFVARGSNFIHNNPDVFGALRRIDPDVIVTTGFNPTHLYAFAYAMLHGVPHVPMTDGTDVSEQALSSVHKLIRRYIYARSPAFIAASRGGLRLYGSYGIAAEHCYQSCLCIDNRAYADADTREARYDLLFCGRVVKEKNPAFALQVAARAADRLGRKVSILFVGTGEAEAEVAAQAASTGRVEAHFHGHAEQHELPALYRSARLFLFPTSADVWGVVANEACAAGLPVIVSPHAGAAGELIVDGDNGFVRELDVERWAQCAAHLLEDDALRRRFGARSKARVRRYTFDQAAAGIVDACRHAVADRRSRRSRWQRRHADT